jgi:uncharacterized spore protein YtfJ
MIQVQEQSTSGEQKEYVETPVKTVFKKFGNNKDVTLVFGEPIEVGLTKVVPVAKLKYAFGGGGDNVGNNGGGGAFTVTPIGVYEITPDQVKFRSTRTRGLVFGLLTVLFGIFFFVVRKKSKK